MSIVGTGTGEIFSFAIPLIEKLLEELQDWKRDHGSHVLVLALMSEFGKPSEQKISVTSPKR